jgi:hypothetical protein
MHRFKPAVSLMEALKWADSNESNDITLVFEGDRCAFAGNLDLPRYIQLHFFSLSLSFYSPVFSFVFSHLPPLPIPALSCFRF